MKISRVLLRWYKSINISYRSVLGSSGISVGAWDRAGPAGLERDRRGQVRRSLRYEKPRREIQA